jgi:hypothetical protein
MRAQGYAPYSHGGILSLQSRCPRSTTLASRSGVRTAAHTSAEPGIAWLYALARAEQNAGVAKPFIAELILLDRR